jgi:hypothetical protein
MNKWMVYIYKGHEAVLHVNSYYLYYKFLIPGNSVYFFLEYLATAS